MSCQQDEAPLIGPPLKKAGPQNIHTDRACCIPAKTCIVFLLGLVLCAALVIGLVLTFIMKNELHKHKANHFCHDQCSFRLVESIPENLTYPSNETVHMPTDEALMELIESAEKTIELVIFYWTLRNKDLPSVHDNSSEKGQLLFDKLLSIGKKQKVKIKIVQNIPSHQFPQHDSHYLKKYAYAEVRNLNMTRLMGSGIVHTKLWLIDRKHFYVGSANADWRSLTQVKEMGILVQNCSCLAMDMAKIYDVYWYLAQDNVTIPSTWGSSYSTYINSTSPETVPYNTDNNGTLANVYLSSSPPPFCPFGRTVDIDAIVSIIRAAKRFVYVAVMDYLPMIAYTEPRKFWSVIDDELRRATIDRGVTVRFLGSLWNHTDPDMPVFLQSLQDLNRVTDPHVTMEVKMFEVPTFTKAQAKIPFARVNHNKYMVTDQHAYIGTSNWYGDYFVVTAGIGFVLTPNTTANGTIDLRQQLENVFLRDWNSVYAHPLQTDTVVKNKRGTMIIN